MRFLRVQKSMIRVPHLKEASWVALGQLAAAGGALLVIKVCTNVLEPDDFGRFSAVLAIVGLAQVCFFGPISQSATRFFSMAVEQGALIGYWRSLSRLYVMAALAVILCWIVLLPFGFQHQSPMPPILIALCALSAGLQTIVVAVLNTKRQRTAVAGIQIADCLVRPLVVLSATLILGRSSQNVIAAYIVTSLIMSLAAFGSSRLGAGAAGLNARSLRLAGGGASSLANQMSAFAWMFVIFGVVGSIGSHGERLLLADFVSWKDVGIYSLLMQLATAPNLLLTSVINQFYLPVVFQSDPDGNAKLGRSYQFYLGFSIVGIAGVALAMAASGQLLVPLLSSSAFLGHEHLLWFLALSAGTFNLGQQLVLPGMRANRLAVYLPGKLVHSAALLCLAILLVPRFGLMGMAFSSAVAAAAYTLSIVCGNVYLAKSAPHRREVKNALLG